MMAAFIIAIRGSVKRAVLGVWVREACGFDPIDKIPFPPN